MWTKGANNEFKWAVKHYDEPSIFGINNGRISKLSIQKISNNEVMANYDRGWDVEPSEEIKFLYDKLINEYN